LSASDDYALSPEDWFEITDPDDPVRAVRWLLRREPRMHRVFYLGPHDPPFDVELARFVSYTLPDEHGEVVIVTPPARTGRAVSESGRPQLYRNVVPFFTRFKDGQWTWPRALSPRVGTGTLDDLTEPD